MTIEIGDKLPDLVLEDQDEKDFNLSQLKGKPAVIFFYPKDFTPGCTKEACGYRDNYQDFRKLGSRVIGISSDSGASHKKFQRKYDLPFRLLSDRDKIARKKFGVKSNFLGLLPGRETFIFDNEGNLTFKYRGLQPRKHVSEAFEALRKLQNKA